MASFLPPASPDLVSPLPRNFSLNPGSTYMRNRERQARRAIDPELLKRSLPPPPTGLEAALLALPSLATAATRGGLSAPDALRLVSEFRLAGGIDCPHCRGARVKRHGWFPDKSGARRQRYRCLSCRKTFNQWTGSPLAGMRRLDLCLDMAVGIVAGVSVRKLAKRLGVHYTTTFRWRHRLLAALLRLPGPVLAGIIEADVLRLPYSEKGQRPAFPGLRRPRLGPCDIRPQAGMLLALDRDQRRLATCLGRGGFQGPLPAHAYPFPAGRLSPGSVVCAGLSQGFLEPVCTRLGLQMMQHLDGQQYTIDNVIELKHRLRIWLRRFRGVSTRHVDKYLTLHGYADRPDYTQAEAIALQLLMAACAAPAACTDPYAAAAGEVA